MFEILVEAVQRGDVAFLRNVQFDVNMTGHGGYSLVHYAVLYNKPFVLNYLIIERKANLYSQTTDRRLTPAHLAAQKGLVHILTSLFDRMKNHSPRDLSCFTPLHYAAA